MPTDHKFDRLYDRRRVLADEKARIIDFLDFELEPPTVGIYDEPVRYFKANKQWCKFIFGWLTWMQDPAFWKDAVDTTYFAIQQILIFEEGIQIPTLPSEGDCISYAPSASFIAYEPQNPFNEPDLIPPDYLMPPWLENSGLEYPEIFGYQATDVFVPFGAINIDPIDLVSFNLPRLEIAVKGPGQVELDLLAVSFGGLAILKVGSMPNIADIILDNIIDTGIQIFDLEMPPSTLIHAGNITRATEVNIEAEPEEITTIYIVFAPKVNDSIIPIAFGGGFRKVDLCGFEESAATMVYEDTRFNPETCSFEKRIDGTWSVIDGNDSWLDCVRAIMATKQEVKEAILESAEQIASRFLSGKGNFEDGLCVEEDGTIIVGEKPIKVPEDEPSTPLFDEELAATAGGCKAVTAGFNSIWADMLAWKTASLSEEVISFRLQHKYQMESPALTDIFVAGYFLDFATGHINSYGEQLSENFFCQGGNFKSVVADYIIEAITFALQETAFKLNDALEDAQITLWFNRGAGVPSTDYIGYNCTKIEDEELSFDMSTAEIVQRTTAGIWKTAHRFLIHVEGTYTDSDNPNIINDGMYSHNTSTGAKTFNPLTFNSGVDAVDTPIQANVPFEAEHVYEFTVDKKTTAADGTCIVSATNTPFTLPNTTGTLTVTITDLGEFAVL